LTSCYIGYLKDTSYNALARIFLNCIPSYQSRHSFVDKHTCYPSKTSNLEQGKCYRVWFLDVDTIEM